MRPSSGRTTSTRCREAIRSFHPALDRAWLWDLQKTDVLQKSRCRFDPVAIVRIEVVYVNIDEVTECAMRSISGGVSWIHVDALPRSGVEKLLERWGSRGRMRAAEHDTLPKTQTDHQSYLRISQDVRIQAVMDGSAPARAVDGERSRYFRTLDIGFISISWGLGTPLPKVTPHPLMER